MPLYRSLGRSSTLGRNPPNGVGKIVGDDERASRIHCHADRSTTRLVVLAKKTSDKIHRWPCGAPVAEWHENDLIADGLAAVPAAVLANEHTLGVVGAHGRAGEIEAKRCHMRS